jgi:hypothetical protein
VEGCQRGPTWKLAPVEGTVTKDGRPLRGIEVVFLADPDAGTQGPQATGRTDEAGHYRLRTDNGDDGVVVGKHRVLLLDAEVRKERKGSARGPQLPENVKPPEDERKPAADAPRVLPRYSSFNETPLRVEIQSGRQVIDFDVKTTEVEMKVIGVPAK